MPDDLTTLKRQYEEQEPIRKYVAALERALEAAILKRNDWKERCVKAEAFAREAETGISVSLRKEMDELIAERTRLLGKVRTMEAKVAKLEQGGD